MPSFPSPCAFFTSLFPARLHMDPRSGYSKAKWSTLKYLPRITGNAVIRFLISFGSTVFPHRAGLRCLCSLWTVSSLGTEPSSRTSLGGCLREIIFTSNTASQKINPFPHHTIMLAQKAIWCLVHITLVTPYARVNRDLKILRRKPL